MNRTTASVIGAAPIRCNMSIVGHADRVPSKVSQTRLPKNEVDGTLVKNKFNIVNTRIFLLQYSS